MEASDGEHAFVADTFNWSAANVAPSVNAGADDTINEGDTFSGGGSFIDPGADTWSATVDYGEGAGSQPLVLVDKTFSLSNLYEQDGNYTVTVCVSDDDTTSCDSLILTVDNVAPSVNAGADATINEGDTFSGSGSFNDPGADTWSATVDYGDGSSSQTLSLNGKDFSLSHLYADNGSYTVTVCVSDDDTTSCDSLLVTVDNVAPIISDLTLGNSSATACLAGNIVTLDFSFSDPGVNDANWIVDIDWGDGSSDAYSTNTQGAQPQQSHTYGAGSYTITVSVTDKDLGTGSNGSDIGAVSFLWNMSGILQQVNAGPPNSIFKYGSTIPVKVKVTDCAGAPVNTLTLKVTWQLLSSGTPTGDVSEPYSTSAADTGNTMRFTGSPDNQYIFNLASKSFPDGTAKYRIYVTIQSTGQLVSADIGLKTK